MSFAVNVRDMVSLVDPGLIPPLMYPHEVNWPEPVPSYFVVVLSVAPVGAVSNESICNVDCTATVCGSGDRPNGNAWRAAAEWSRESKLTAAVGSSGSSSAHPSLTASAVEVQRRDRRLIRLARPEVETGRQPVLGIGCGAEHVVASDDQ
jgi:hypothetical protein